jgi:hypothetical protein
VLIAQLNINPMRKRSLRRAAAYYRSVGNLLFPVKTIAKRSETGSGRAEHRNNG